MSSIEKANLIAYLSSPGGPARFYLRWPFHKRAPMGAAMVFNRDASGSHVIVTNGPMPSCKLLSWGVTDAPVEALATIFDQAEKWFAENSDAFD